MPHLDREFLWVAKTRPDSRKVSLSFLTFNQIWLVPLSPNIFGSSISIFFGMKMIFLKNDLQQTKGNFKNIGILVVKNHLLMQFVKSPWLKHLVIHLCLWVVFLSRKIFFTNNVIWIGGEMQIIMSCHPL